MPTRSSTKKKTKPKREGTRRVVEQAIGERLSGSWDRGSRLVD